MQSGLNAPKFLWNANDFEYFRPNVDSLMDFLQSGDIYDEDRDYFTFDQFMNDELKGSIDKGYNLAEYYKSNPTLVPYHIPLSEKLAYQEKFNVTVDNYGEFNIGKYRFTIHTEFC